MPVVSITKGVVARRHPRRAGYGASPASQRARVVARPRRLPHGPRPWAAVARHRGSFLSPPNDYEDAGVMLTTGIKPDGRGLAPDQASSRRSEPAGEFAGLEEREAGAS